MVHREAGFTEREVDGWKKLVDRIGCQAAEVEVSGLPVHVAADDQCRPVGKHEVFRFLQAGDDRCHLLLKRAQHLHLATVTPKPVGPCPPNGRRQDELVPELAELVGVNVEADVVFGAFPKDLLVDARPVGAVGQVVGQRRSAPTDVAR